MIKIQNKIKEFNDERSWNDPVQMKDLLLNMNEEIGEFWTLIKWVDSIQQQKLINENKKEVEDFVGDMLYLTLKIAYLCDIDSKKAIENVLAEYERRFPKDKVRGHHGNIRAGGVDFK